MQACCEQAHEWFRERHRVAASLQITGNIQLSPFLLESFFVLKSRTSKWLKIYPSYIIYFDLKPTFICTYLSFLACHNRAVEEYRKVYIYNRACRIINGWSLKLATILTHKHFNSPVPWTPSEIICIWIWNLTQQLHIVYSVSLESLKLRWCSPSAHHILHDPRTLKDSMHLGRGLMH
jgi:hypothetical protein